MQIQEGFSSIVHLLNLPHRFVNFFHEATLAKSLLMIEIDPDIFFSLLMSRPIWRSLPWWRLLRLLQGVRSQNGVFQAIVLTHFVMDLDPLTALKFGNSYLENFHFSNLLAASESFPNKAIYSSFRSVEATDFENAI